jgi:hypothetical protein
MAEHLWTKPMPMEALRETGPLDQSTFVNNQPDQYSAAPVREYPSTSCGQSNIMVHHSVEALERSDTIVTAIKDRNIHSARPETECSTESIISSL